MKIFVIITYFYWFQKQKLSFYKSQIFKKIFKVAVESVKKMIIICKNFKTY